MPKYYLYTLCSMIALVLTACNNNNPSELYLSQDQREAKMYEQLSSLKQKYRCSFPDSEKHIKRLKKTDEETTELSMDDDDRIAKADAWGALEGASIGVTLGGLFGSAIPAVGTSMGAVGGGGVGAAIYAIRRSKEEADKIREEHNETNIAIEDIYKLNFDNPINDFSCSCPLFDNSIRYANIGFIHNFIISSLYNEDRNTFWDISNEELATALFENYFSPLDWHEYDNLYSYITLDFGRGNENEFSSSNSDEIIQFYFEEISEIQESSLSAYTEDFMQIVDQYLSGWEDERVLCINSCISTFYYSKCLWNLNVPYNYSGEYLIFNLQNGTWSYTLCDREWLDITLMSNSGNILVFIPRLNTYGELTNLFLMDYNNLSQLEHLNQNQYIIRTNETLSLNLSPENQFFYENTENTNHSSIFIPAGTYNLERFDKGYLLSMY